MKIFISYRRMDSEESTGRIYDRLVEEFGKESIFRDIGYNLLQWMEEYDPDNIPTPGFFD